MRLCVVFPLLTCSATGPSHGAVAAGRGEDQGPTTFVASRRLPKDIIVQPCVFSAPPAFLINKRTRARNTLCSRAIDGIQQTSVTSYVVSIRAHAREGMRSYYYNNA